MVKELNEQLGIFVYPDARSKQLSFDEDYVLYEDGRLWSKKSDKFLKPLVIKSNKGDGTKRYLSYRLNNKKRFLINRLLMLEFSIFDFPNYECIGLVVNNSDDYRDSHINNLSIMNQSQINKKYNIKPVNNNINNLIKINEDQKERVIELLKDHTNKQIGDIYGVSEMTVHRFIKRHQINKHYE